MSKRQITINTRPVSDAYSEANEKRIEFAAYRTDVAENGSYNTLMGGLISFTVIRANGADVPEDKLIVNVYRTDPNVEVQWAPDQDLDRPPRFGPRAVGGYVRVTGGQHAGWTGQITHVPDRTIIVIRLDDSDTFAAVRQINAETIARPASAQASGYDEPVQGEDDNTDREDWEAANWDAAALLPTGELMNPAHPEDATYYDKGQVAYVVRKTGPDSEGALRVLTSFGPLAGWKLDAEHKIRHDQTARDLGTWRVIGIRNYKTSKQAGEIPDRPLRQWVFK